MFEAYDDIRSRIAEPPLWFDENGVPRYEPHAPKYCPDIYANEVLLLEIACQACGERFLVQMSSGKWNFSGGEVKKLTLKPVEKLRGIHYGDPPRHATEASCAGETMNCEDLRVVEFWERELLEWRRVPELEIALEEVGH